MSDEPSCYDEDQLKDLLTTYFSQNLFTAQRIRDVLLPACLEREHITREELKQEFIKKNAASDSSKVGYFLSLISGQIGMQKNDFLRQIVGYEYPNNLWEKDNYFIRSEYHTFVKNLLESLNGIHSNPHHESTVAAEPSPAA